MPLLNTYRFIANHPLTKNHKFGAMVRWLKWQIGSRLVPGPVAVSYVNETRLLAKPGMTGATGNIYCGLHEFEDMGFVLHFLRPGDMFVDIGANIGSYSLLASATGAKVVCFEPVPVTFESLLDNIGLNHLNDTVDARNQAVGKDEGELEMIADQDTTNQAVHEGEQYAGQTVRVPVTTLDNTLQGKIPKLIKIDVEGFETEVLAGADSTFKNPDLQAVIMELNGSGNRYGFDEDSLHEFMLLIGFESCSYCPIKRELSRIEREDISTGNTLYVRYIHHVQSVVKDSDRYRVLDVML